MTDLLTVLEEDPVRLEPLTDDHIEPLRIACAEDQDIWQIYPVNMLGDDFDRAVADFRARKSWINFAVLDCQSDKLVGMTNYINPDPANGVTEIGGTFISPAVRSTGFNRMMKRLMIDHALAQGFYRVELRVDTRNTRSMAAVSRLGAKQDGTLRGNRVTWTGYRRDTAVFSILKDEWQG
ncbi:N-acetyltransferase [Altericroceibacterium spongiae]|uniref:N-acetyltransferase n=1 Tax=Altericroceibacterium spongiae TaxID=2320269 RepID=A0A420EQV0_9SPHN|nr:GNAT family protein [Altericroceibacterium spongiae]RKF23054.1 N-acetyltransferase [Altericroceibacterium spongiae]